MKAHELRDVIGALVNAEDEKEQIDAAAILLHAHFEAQERIAKALEVIAAHSYPSLRT